MVGGVSLNIVKNKLILVPEQEIEYTETIIRCMDDLFDFLHNIVKISQEPEELLCVITLTNANQIQSFMEVARGTTDCCRFNELDVYKRVILSNCRKFILVHNHTSGRAVPSENDKKVTENMKKTSEILGLQFLDHIIVGNNTYCSCFEHKKNTS